MANVFHLIVEDLEAGDRDHILLAVDDLEAAVAIHEPRRRWEEAVRSHCLGVSSGPVPIAGHHCGPRAQISLARRRQVRSRLVRIVIRRGNGSRWCRSSVMSARLAVVRAWFPTSHRLRMIGVPVALNQALGTDSAPPMPPPIEARRRSTSICRNSG